MMLAGLCVLPACFASKYELVQTEMTWTEAQIHCRETFNDLASVNSEEDLNELRNVISSAATNIFWLGLSLDVNSWLWSLEKEGFYANRDAEFRKWKKSTPNNHKGEENCVRMGKDGTWDDISCLKQYTFVCYNGKR